MLKKLNAGVMWMIDVDSHLTHLALDKKKKVGSHVCLAPNLGQNQQHLQKHCAYEERSILSVCVFDMLSIFIVICIIFCGNLYQYL